MMKTPALVLGAIVVASCALASCKPDLDDRESRIDEPRMVAIVGEPPEAKPGEPVTYTAVLASPEGRVAGAAIQWAFCATPKLLTENGAVSAVCASDGQDGMRPLGPGQAGTTVTAATLADACALFGSDSPPGEFRPRDPDSTGGYYQPLRATWGAVTGFARERISCNLANAPADVTLEFKRRYDANRNPKLGPLVARVDGQVIAGSLPPGRRIDLTAAWDEGDAESYVALDPVTKTVAQRRESMRVSWYATAGSFDTDRTGRTEAELENFANNGWSSEATSGPVHFWVVLRDSRGGTAYATYTLQVDGR